MTFFLWLLRLIRDILLQAWVNRSYAMGFVILLLLVLGLVIVGAQVSAPFIYTLF